MSARKININFTVTLTDQDVEDIVVTALEGGIGYWACLDNTGKEFEEAPEDEPVSVTAAKILLNGGNLCFFDEEDDSRPIDMDMSDLCRGFAVWIESYSGSLALDFDHQIDLSDFDAECADIVFQIALLDDVVYG